MRVPSFHAVRRGCAPLFRAGLSPSDLKGMASFRRKFLIAFLVIAALGLPYWGTFFMPGQPMDEGSLLVYPEQILKGKAPYRDFETFYGPASVYVLAGAYQLFGPSINVERTVGALYRVLIFAAIFALFQRWGNTLAAGAVTLAGLALLPIECIAYAWFGGLSCALWALWALRQDDRPRRCYFAGLLGSCALLYRPDLGPALILSMLPFFISMSWRNRGALLAGVACGLLPLVVILFVAGPAQVLNNLFLYPVIYGNPGRRLPLWAFAPGLLSLHFVAVGINLAAGSIAVYAERQSNRARTLLALALFSLAITHQAVQRSDFWHVTFAAFFSIALAPVSLSVLAGRLRGLAMPSRTQALLACVSVFAVFAFANPRFIPYAQNKVGNLFGSEKDIGVYLTINGRPYCFEDVQEAAKLAKVLASLQAQSKPGQRLFVGPGDLRRTAANDTFIYYLMPQLAPATYFLEMNPLSANRPDSRLASDVASADWLLLDRSWNSNFEPNEAAKLGSDAPNKVVASLFEVCAAQDQYVLLRRKQATVPPADSAAIN